MSDEEANTIENRAADLSYKCGFGVGEWEAFLTTEDVKRLIELGEQGFGTWGREPETLAQMKRNLELPDMKTVEKSKEQLENGDFCTVDRWNELLKDLKEKE